MIVLKLTYYKIHRLYEFLFFQLHLLWRIALLVVVPALITFACIATTPAPVLWGAISIYALLIIEYIAVLI